MASAVTTWRRSVDVVRTNLHDDDDDDDDAAADHRSRVMHITRRTTLVAD